VYHSNPSLLFEFSYWCIRLSLRCVTKLISFPGLIAYEYGYVNRHLNLHVQTDISTYMCKTTSQLTCAKRHLNLHVHTDISTYMCKPIFFITQLVTDEVASKNKVVNSCGCSDLSHAFRNIRNVLTHLLRNYQP
jgi:hypothetical protein